MNRSSFRFFFCTTMGVLTAAIFIFGQFFTEGLHDVWGRSYSFLDGWISGALFTAAYVEYRAWRGSGHPSSSVSS